MQFGILRPFWGVGCIGRKRRSIFGEGKVGKCLEFENIWSAEEQEKEGNIWRRKMFGVGKYFVPRGKVKGGKYLKKEDIWKKGNIWRRQRREIFGEGKFSVLRGERGDGKFMERDNICRRKKENEDNI